MMRITLLAGFDKQGKAENFEKIEFNVGELWAIVGSTGAGKSRLIKDIEMLVDGDSITGRKVLVNDTFVEKKDKRLISENFIAHLEQNMRFTLDLTVSEFLTLHGKATGKEKIDIAHIIALANLITEEPIKTEDSLSHLSGGQSRALMAADIATLSDRQIVLIDEIENAGIDKEAALEVLLKENKLVLIVTHDPHTALMAKRRIVLKNGAIIANRERSLEEEQLFKELDKEYQRRKVLLKELRQGEELL